MDTLRRIQEAFAEARDGSPENPSTSLSSPDAWFLEWATGGGPTGSGMVVSEETALRLTAVFACIRILAETIGSLPLLVYERTAGGGKNRVDSHPLAELLHDGWNEYMTASVGRETLQGQLSGRGNGYCIIERAGSGEILGFWPVPTSCIEPLVDGNRLWYRITAAAANIIGVGPGVYAPENVLHVQGLSSDGIRGYSPIALAREAIGLGLAAEQFGARFFGNGARAGGFLSTDKPMTQPEQNALLSRWNAIHHGVEKAHKIAILGNGLKWNQYTISQEDAQFLETRKFQVAEIARMFRVPLALLDEHDKAATYASVEQFMLSFAIHTVRPISVRWEQEIKRKCFTPNERRRLFAEFNLDALVRGDLKTRYDAHRVALECGIKNLDEVRSQENLNPLPDGLGQTHYRPANLTAIGSDPADPDPTDDGGIAGKETVQ